MSYTCLKSNQFLVTTGKNNIPNKNLLYLSEKLNLYIYLKNISYICLKNKLFKRKNISHPFGKTDHLAHLPEQVEI